MANPFTSKTASSMGGYLPGEWDAELRDIDRQRKMAEILLQQSQTPLQGQMVGGIYVAPHWTQGLAKVANAWASNYANKEADRRQTALGQAQDQEFQTTAQKYAAALRGDTLNPGEQGPVRPGDPAAARNVLMESKSPQWRQMGMQQLMAASSGNADKFGKINPHDYTPESIKAFSTTGDFSALVPVRKQEVAPSGVVYNPYDVKPGTVFNDPNKLVSIGPDGQPVINQIALDAKSRVQRAGASNITVNTGAKAFEQELGKLDAKTLDEMRGKAQAATETLGLVENMRGAIKQGVYSGGGAQAKTAAASMIAGITGVTPKGLPGSETFNAEASKLVLERIKTLGANPSNADREFIEKTVPTLSTSPQARDQLISFLEKKAKDAIELHRSADAYARKNHGLGGWSGVVAPQPTQDIHSQADAIINGGK